MSDIVMDGGSENLEGPSDLINAGNKFVIVRDVLHAVPRCNRGVQSGTNNNSKLSAKLRKAVLAAPLVPEGYP